jgi:hypothetical protein
VLVDAGHGNFHTIDGRFAAFARLLELDGFRVEGSTAGLSPALLAGADVFVIANAVHGGETAEWILPTAAAFTPEEIDVLVDWVRDGGSLLLIADHMPFPGAVAGIADRFGIVFHNGYAMASIEEGGSMDFTRSSGRLADHAITRGRSAAESVSSVRAFTGQAFRFVVPAQALLHLPEDWEVYLPLEAGEFGDTTPLVPARGLLQGGVMRFGSGRVAVFGEAALFTAQSYVLDGVTRQMGMNHPSAAQNAQFVLNVMHWLTGLLDGLATAD